MISRLFKNVQFDQQNLKLYGLFFLCFAAINLFGQWLNGVPPDNSPLYSRLTGFTYDLLLPESSQISDPRVVLIDIDEKSLAEQGRWPWSRTKVAQLLERIQQAEPAGVGLDILFPEPSNAAADEQLFQQLKQDNVTSAITFEMPEEQASKAELDAAWPQAEKKIGLSLSLMPKVFETGKLGHITPTYSKDHVIRKIYPIICQQACYPTLAVSMLENWSGMPAQFQPSEQILKPDKLCVMSFCLALNADKSVYIPYQHHKSFRSFSATEMLSNGGVLPDLKGAFVIVGTSAVGLGDRVSTPQATDVPGVQLHAVLLAAMLDGFVWSELDWQQELLALVMIFVLIVSVFWPGYSTVGKLIACAILISVAMFPLLFLQINYWVQPLTLWFVIGSTIFGFSVWEIAYARFHRRKMYGAFSSYVPSVVIKSLLKNNASTSELEAKRVEATVMFADIQGFTSLSEQLTPEQLVEITNHLFTGITSEVYKYGGTLDKYMGDAVMAFWGAPLQQEDHALLAIECALSIQELLNGLDDWLAERGFPEIKMNIGLETGVVTVGNLGSKQRRAYTVMGKAANVASHLQKQCEQLGHNVLCGPQLCTLIPIEQMNFLEVVAIRGLEGKQKIGFPSIKVEG